jgi:hypothetical protein
MALNNDDIKQLIAILQKGLETEDNQQVEDKPKPKPRKKRAIKTKTNNNKFENMPEFSMFKQDTEIDKKLNVMPPTERTRQYKPVQVKCRSCGKEEKVNPSLVESKERYKCNKCSSSAG